MHCARVCSLLTRLSSRALAPYSHGWHLGEQGEWTKKTEFELGPRVPLLIAAPHLPQSAGRVSAELAELVDVLQVDVLLTPR